MKKLILIMLSLVFLAGCASLDIKPITKKQATGAHKSNNNINGYILHAPKVYILVTNLEKECKISTFLMPDKERPFSVDIKEGIGKIDAKIDITNGWMLGNFSANIDNTSVLNSLKGAVPTNAQSASSDKSKPAQPICGMENGVYTSELKKVN